MEDNGDETAWAPMPVNSVLRKRKQRVLDLVSDQPPPWEKMQTVETDGNEAWIKTMRSDVVRWGNATFNHVLAKCPVEHGKGENLYHREVYDLMGRGKPLKKFPRLEQLMKWATRHWHTWDSKAEENSLSMNTVVVEWSFGAPEEFKCSLSDPFAKYIFSFGAKRGLTVQSMVDRNKHPTKLAIYSSAILVVSPAFDSKFVHSFSREHECRRPHIRVTIKCI
jgi:hypothetical protein